MLITSQIITAGSGSIGGLVASHNRGGQYFRGRTIPTNPNSTFQQGIRQAMSVLSNRWQSTLTSAQRTAWNVYAANVTVINKLGQAVNLTGQQMYIRSNIELSRAVLTLKDSAPTVFNLGAFSTVVLTATAPTTLSLQFDATNSWNADDGYLFVYASRPQNSGVSFFRGPWRVAGALVGDTGTPLTSPQSLTAPFVLTAGQKVFCYARAMQPDGRLSAEGFFSDVVS